MKRLPCVLLLGLVVWMLLPASVWASFTISPGIVRITIPANETSTTASIVTISNQKDTATQYRAYAGLPNAPTQINPDYAVIENLNWVSVSPEYVTIAPQSTSTVTVTLITPEGIKEGKQKFWLFVADTSSGGNINMMYAVKFLITVSNQMVETNQTVEVNQTVEINQTVLPATLDLKVEPTSSLSQQEITQNTDTNPDDPNRLPLWVYPLIIGCGMIAVFGLSALQLRKSK